MSEIVGDPRELGGHPEDIFGHPKGLYVCFATEMWERFSFYGMKFLLLLYLTKYHLFTDNMSLDVLGGYAALVYAMPVIGGLLANAWLGRLHTRGNAGAGHDHTRHGGRSAEDRIARG